MHTQKIFNKLVASGCDEKTAAIAANIDNIEKYNSKAVLELINNINLNDNSVDRVSDVVSEFLSTSKKSTVAKINKYAKTINMQDVYDAAPQVKDYTPEQMLKFLDYHSSQNTKVFNTDTLKVDGDFTNYLMENYLDADSLTELLTVKPLTQREVGSVPKGWLTNVPSGDAGQKVEHIYMAINDFQTMKDQSMFASDLKDILGKEVKVEQLGSGSFGTGYKVSVEGSEDVCLKLFDGLKTDNNSAYNSVHGQHIEVQTGLFVNKHSDDFVKMYFGRVAGNNDRDGFLVTQYLSDNVVPKNVSNIEGGYAIKSQDAYGNHNIINGKIIDFGAVIIKKK